MVTEEQRSRAKIAAAFDVFPSGDIDEGKWVEFTEGMVRSAAKLFKESRMDYVLLQEIGPRAHYYMHWQNFA